MANQESSNQLIHANDNSIDRKQKRLKIFVTVCGLVLVGLHAYGAIYPSAGNWGIHLLAFFSPLVASIFLLLMLSLLFPSVQLWIVTRIENIARNLESRSKFFVLILTILFTGLVLVSFWIWREKTFFLGDGFMIIRWLPIIRAVEYMPQAFKHEPLAGLVMWSLYKFLMIVQVTSNPEIAIRWLSILSGVGFIAILFFLVRHVAPGLPDRILLFLFVFTAGGSQLFFGYIENYAPAYTCVLLYITVSLAYVRGKCRLLLPAAVFGVLLTLNFGMLCMVPSFLLLLYYEFRSGRIVSVLFSSIAVMATSILILWCCRYPAALLYEVLFRTEKHVVPWRETTSGWQAYTLFSMQHFQELANLFLLLSPFAVALFIVSFAFYPVRSILKNPGPVFVMCSGLCGLAFLFIVNADLGMSRDWDLLSSFTVGFLIAAACCMALVEPAQVRRQILVVIVGMSLLHTIPWVLINADEERSLARIRLLPDEQLWGGNAFRMYEELAIYYRDHNDPRTALACYKKYLRYDSTEARIFGNIADVCATLGDGQQEFLNNEKAIQLGSTSPGVYLNQGIACANQSRFEEAIPLLRKSLEYNPNQPAVVNMIGAILMRSKEAYREALPLFQQTLGMDSTYALAYLNAGVCYYHLHDAAGTKSFLTKFLQLQPSYQRADELREMINSF